MHVFLTLVALWYWNFSARVTGLVYDVTTGATWMAGMLLHRHRVV